MSNRSNVHVNCVVGNVRKFLVGIGYVLVKQFIYR